MHTLYLGKSDSKTTEISISIDHKEKIAQAKKVNRKSQTVIVFTRLDTI